MTTVAKRAGGILLLYNRPVGLGSPGASTVADHVAAYGRHSSFPVWAVNTELGFPSTLPRRRFDAIVLHYSLFGTVDYKLSPEYLEYLRASRPGSYLVAFFQDEFRFCRHRFAFLDEHSVDCVFSCLEPPHVERVYGEHTGVPRLETNVPGYVSEEMVAAGRRFAVPEADRTVDVVYRGRHLPAYVGLGGREKYEIGDRFAAAARGRGLTLDIAGEEADRIYGDDWYRFLARARAVLGTESGVDVFDLEDEVTREFERLVASGVQAPTVEMLAEPLARWEGPIPYRTISPRHFEAAALGVCQILYEGHYSGAMEPMVHYIPLRKDFSNFEEALERFADQGIRAELAANARRDLIDSGRWSYAALIGRLDGVLRDAGLEPETSPSELAAISAEVSRGLRGRALRHYRKQVASRMALRAREILRPVTRSVRRGLRRVRSN